MLTASDGKKRLKKDLTCSHYGKKGHLKEKCYRLVGFLKDFKFTKSKTNSKKGKFVANNVTSMYEDESTMVQPKQEENSAGNGTMSQISVIKQQVSKLIELLNENGITCSDGPSIMDMIRVARASSGLYLMQDSQVKQDLSQFSFKNLVKNSFVSFVDSFKSKYKDFDLWHFSLPTADSTSPTEANYDIDPNQPIRKSTRTRNLPKYLEAYQVDLPSHASAVTSHPIAKFVSHHNLSPAHKAFTISLTSIQEHKTYHQVVTHSHWRHAMAAELQALEDNDTWSMYRYQLVVILLVLDVNNTFLHEDLDEEVYIDLPEGYVVQGEYLEDYSLFTMNTNDGEFIALLTYVDDILIGSTSAQTAAARKYTLDLLEEYGLLGAKPTSTLIDYNTKLTKASQEEEITDPTRYRQLVGKLLYLTFTRPDISFAMQTLAQFMDKPAHDHYMAAYRVLKYLKGALGQGILMGADSTVKISAYCDSD
ncbi:Uncharacterized protein TCM_014135 [Theobroma cacao]|uniref:Reverse transcriptase Ty1/copia-type domain-containing protein n=1 Tax=Theobroma cacao TaxID=3641 RepID=A0A061FY13_THECC|nr:Uncharacterized protein TCM_014135 [Theobroma cacao]